MCLEGHLRLTAHALAGFPVDVECLVGTAPTMGRWTQLASKSGTRALGQARSTDFLCRVRNRPESLGFPDLTATFVAGLTFGRRTGTPR